MNFDTQTKYVTRDGREIYFISVLGKYAQFSFKGSNVKHLYNMDGTWAHSNCPTNMDIVECVKTTTTNTTTTTTTNTTTTTTTNNDMMI